MVSGKTNKNSSNTRLTGLVVARGAVTSWNGPFPEYYWAAKYSKMLYARFALVKIFKRSYWIALRSIEGLDWGNIEDMGGIDDGVVFLS